jgi:hypothetical protein
MGGGVSNMQKRPKMIKTVLRVKGQIRQSGKWIKWSSQAPGKRQISLQLGGQIH